jgi:hypothetical protein
MDSVSVRFFELDADSLDGTPREVSTQSFSGCGVTII